MNPRIPARMKHTVPWTKVVLVLRNPVERLYSQYKMIVRDVFDLRQYSVEDLLVYELTAMKEKFRMTTAPLPTRTVPNTTTTTNNNSRSSSATTPTTSNYSGYAMPKTVPFDHPRPVKEWRPKQEMAILKKPDTGPLRNHNCVRRGLYSVQLEWWLRHYTLHSDLMVINYDDLVHDTRSVYTRMLEFANIPLPPALDEMDFGQKVRADDRRDERPLSEETRNYLAGFYAPYNARLESLLGPEWSADKLQWNE